MRILRFKKRLSPRLFVFFVVMRKQLLQRFRIEYIPGKNVRDDLAPLFEEADTEIDSLLLRELLETDGGGEARWTATDDDDIVGHGLARCRCVRILVRRERRLQRL